MGELAVGFLGLGEVCDNRIGGGFDMVGCAWLRGVRLIKLI